MALDSSQLTQAAGRQRPQHQAEKGEGQRDQHHGQVVQHPVGKRVRAEPLPQPRRQRAGKAPRGEGGAQQQRQGKDQLDGGQAALRRLGQRQQPLGLGVVLLLRLAAEFSLGQGRYCRLRGSKKTMDRDQYDQYQQLR